MGLDFYALLDAVLGPHLRGWERRSMLAELDRLCAAGGLPPADAVRFEAVRSRAVLLLGHKNGTWPEEARAGRTCTVPSVGAVPV